MKNFLNVGFLVEFIEFFVLVAGSKTPDILRQKLEDAMKQKDKDQLDKVIRECVAAGMPELRDHVQQARRASDILGGGTGG